MPAAAESVLLVEYESDTPAEAARLAHDLANRLQRGERLALFAHVADDEPSRERLWQVREAALPSLYGLRGTAQPLGLRRGRGRAAGTAAGLPAPRSGSASAPRDHGVLPHSRRHRAGPHAAVRRVARPGGRRKAMGVGRRGLSTSSSISAAPSAPSTAPAWRGRPGSADQAGPLFSVFRELKSIFDPHHLLNPGKIVGPLPGRAALAAAPPCSEPAPARRQRNGDKETSLLAPAAPAVLALTSERLATECQSCNGCGECRTESPGPAHVSHSSGPRTRRPPRRAPRPT